MDSKRRKNRAWPTVTVLTVSLLLHAALLLLPLPALRDPSSRPKAPAMVVDLLPAPAPPLPETPEQDPQPQRPPPDPVQRPKPTKSPESALAVQAEESTPPETPVAPASSGAGKTADRIQAQLLSAARAVGRESEEAEEVQALQYKAAPALPSQSGWLHRYTGRVATSVDRWRGNDGSHSARVVTGSGQVICVRTRAPTAGEIFNPWMSAAVPMVHGCGRERPRAIDGADPWVRRPSGGRE